MQSFYKSIDNINEKAKELSQYIVSELREERIARLINIVDCTDAEEFSKSMDELYNVCTQLTNTLKTDYRWISSYNEKEYDVILTVLKELLKFTSYKDEILNYNEKYVTHERLTSIANFYLAKSYGNFYFTPITKWVFDRIEVQKYSRERYKLLEMHGPTYKDLFYALLNCTKEGYILITNEYGKCIAIIPARISFNLLFNFKHSFMPFISEDLIQRIKDDEFFKGYEQSQFDLDNKEYIKFLNRYAENRDRVSNFSVIIVDASKTWQRIAKGEKVARYNSHFNQSLFDVEDYQTLDEIEYDFPEEAKREFVNDRRKAVTICIRED